jgi:hypothetical protein
MRDDTSWWQDASLWFDDTPSRSSNTTAIRPTEDEAIDNIRYEARVFTIRLLTEPKSMVQSA